MFNTHYLILFLFHHHFPIHHIFICICYLYKINTLCIAAHIKGCGFFILNCYSSSRAFVNFFFNAS